MLLASTAILRDMKSTMGIFSNAKDRMLEQMALTYLNTNLLEPYGRATQLRINSAKKSVHVEIELKGETTPVKVELTEYDLTKEGERYFVVVKEIQTSREWLTTLAREQVCNSPFELPSQVGRMLMMAL